MQRKKLIVSAIAVTAGMALFLGACAKASDDKPTKSEGQANSSQQAAGSDAASPVQPAPGSGTTAPGSDKATTGGATSGAEAAEDLSCASGKTMEIVSKGFQHKFWQTVKQGAESEAKKLGMTVNFDGPATEQDLEPQLNMLKQAVTKKPDAIGFAALDSQAASPVIDDIKAAKIPMIAFDSGVDSDYPLSTAATDSKAAAGEAAKHMAELIGNKGTVAVVAHDQTSQTGKDRRDGFLEWMKANAPDIKVLDVQYGSSIVEAANVTKTFLSANPDLAGIYGTNEAAASGVVQGAKESGKKGIVIVGFDSSKAQIDAIRSGEMAGAITQNPVGIGEKTVWAGAMAICGKELPKVIDTGFYWYDKNNIDDPKIAAVLYN